MVALDGSPETAGSTDPMNRTSRAAEDECENTHPDHEYLDANHGLGHEWWKCSRTILTM